METYQLSREKDVISRMPGARGDFIFDENVVKTSTQKHSELGPRHVLVVSKR